MTCRYTQLLALSALALIGACASPTRDYPSLAVRDAERVSGTLGTPAPPPAPLAIPASVRDRAATLEGAARAAHADFLTAASELRAPIRAGQGNPVASEEWSAAQIALALLSGYRSETMVALADLDLIYARAVDEGLALAPISQARTKVESMVADQDRLITALSATPGE